MTKRVCFVVDHATGSAAEGGEAAAGSSAALALAGAGHEVVLVHTGDGPEPDRRSAERFRAAGVTVEPLPGEIVAPACLAGSYRALAHLRDRDFDAIVFEDGRALGWASVRAKRTGTAFAHTQLVHLCHRPEAWRRETDGQVGADVDSLTVAHAGQVAAEESDTVVSPSRALLDWMVGARWRLPTRRFVAPAPDEADTDALALWNEILRWEPPVLVDVRERPLVTAVVPHHDRPTLVTAAVEALDAQDYENLEIVVVDDGSEQAESHQVLGEIAASSWRHPVRVLRRENRWPGAARNAGVAAGRGDLLTFVDDDDVPEPHFVSTLVRAIQRTGAAAVTCAMHSFVKPTGVPGPADSQGTWVFTGGPLHLAAVQNCIGGTPAVIRRDAFEAVGGFHEHFGLGLEDWHLYVRLLFAGYDLVAVPEPLYWYRLHDRSLQSNLVDYQSVQLILEEFRQALPPALRLLPDLALGQNVVLRERTAAHATERDQRERVLWLAEERARRLAAAAADTPVPGDRGRRPAPGRPG